MNRHLTTTVTLAWAVVLFVVPLPFLAALAYGLPSLYSGQLFGIELGVIAYTWMLAAVYLACRPRWVDRTVGLPHMMMIHGILAILAIGFAFVHQSLLPGAGALVGLTGHVGLYLFIAVAVWSLVFMAGWLTSRVRWLENVKRTLERVFRHEMSVWLHRFNLIAIAIILIHVHVIDYIAAIKPFILLIDAATIIVFAYYAWSMINRHAYALRGRVIAVRPLADRVTELSVGLDGDSARNARWRPGDFAFVAVPGERGMHEYHPFSLTNSYAPDSGSAPQPMMFAIRADGDFTTRVASLQPGTAVRVVPPYGRYAEFVDEHPANAPLVLIGGGIGITPLIGVLTAYAGTGRGGGRSVDFLYTVSKDRDVIYGPELTRFGEDHPNARVRISLHRPDETALTPMIRPGAVYLVAGPHAMIVAVRKTLLAHGVRADDIYYEPFAM